MSELHLTVGNKNYSSWSKRAWVLLRQLDIPFTENTIWLYEAESAGEKAALPAGRVPVLRDGDLVIWDSLAIAEYVAERCPDRGVWPSDPAGRATARSYCAEMHSGFPDLRNDLPMNCRRRKPAPTLSDATRRDVDRIIAMWTAARSADPAGGPFLFGAFSAADAFFAPVVSRFETYSIELRDQAADYAAAVRATAAYVEWHELAATEDRTIDLHERA